MKGGDHNSTEYSTVRNIQGHVFTQVLLRMYWFLRGWLRGVPRLCQPRAVQILIRISTLPRTELDLGTHNVIVTTVDRWCYVGVFSFLRSRTPLHTSPSKLYAGVRFRWPFRLLLRVNVDIQTLIIHIHYDPRQYNGQLIFLFKYCTQRTPT